MKTRTIISAAIVVIFALLGGASDEDEDLGSYFSKIMITMLIIAVIFIAISVWINHSEKVQQREEEEKRKKYWEEKQKDFNNWYNSYVSSAGKPDKIITIKQYDTSNVIYVHEAQKRVYIQGKNYDFKDIISCTFTDSPKTYKGQLTSVTKSDNRNTIGRAIVGGAIAGPAGAIIGGSTSKKITSYEQGTDKIVHDYTVVININSISNPIIRINTGDDGRLTNDIVGLMNVIILRK